MINSLNCVAKWVTRWFRKKWLFHNHLKNFHQKFEQSLQIEVIFKIES